MDDTTFMPRIKEQKTNADTGSQSDMIAELHGACLNAEDINDLFYSYGNDRSCCDSKKIHSTFMSDEFPPYVKCITSIKPGDHFGFEELIQISTDNALKCDNENFKRKEGTSNIVDLSQLSSMNSYQLSEVMKKVRQELKRKTNYDDTGEPFAGEGMSLLSVKVESPATDESCRKYWESHRTHVNGDYHAGKTIRPEDDPSRTGLHLHNLGQNYLPTKGGRLNCSMCNSPIELNPLTAKRRPGQPKKGHSMCDECTASVWVHPSGWVSKWCHRHGKKEPIDLFKSMKEGSCQLGQKKAATWTRKVRKTQRSMNKSSQSQSAEQQKAAVCVLEAVPLAIFPAAKRARREC